MTENPSFHEQRAQAIEQFAALSSDKDKFPYVEPERFFRTQFVKAKGMIGAHVHRQYFTPILSNVNFNGNVHRGEVPQGFAPLGHSIVFLGGNHFSMYWEHEQPKVGFTSRNVTEVFTGHISFHPDGSTSVFSNPLSKLHLMWEHKNIFRYLSLKPREHVLPNPEQPLINFVDQTKQVMQHKDSEELIFSTVTGGTQTTDGAITVAESDLATRTHVVKIVRGNQVTDEVVVPVVLDNRQVREASFHPEVLEDPAHAPSFGDFWIRKNPLDIVGAKWKKYNHS